IKDSDTLQLDQENINPIGIPLIEHPLIRRPKGRRSGTTRFKSPLETSSCPNEVRSQNKCSLC
ncbi:3770_t:CDS:1, partial [Funneliformis mosseae]